MRQTDAHKVAAKVGGAALGATGDVDANAESKKWTTGSDDARGCACDADGGDDSAYMHALAESERPGEL